MRLDLRDEKGPRTLNPKGDNPYPYYGIQQIPDDGILTWNNRNYDMTPITRAYGNGRIRLNDTDENMNVLPSSLQSGYYLHGKHDSHNWTHGCVCDKSETIFNSFWKNPYRGNVPFSVRRRK